MIMEPLVSTSTSILSSVFVETTILVSRAIKVSLQNSSSSKYTLRRICYIVAYFMISERIQFI